MHPLSAANIAHLNGNSATATPVVAPAPVLVRDTIGEEVAPPPPATPTNGAGHLPVIDMGPGANIEEVAAAIVVTAGAGVAPAQALAAQMPHAAACDVAMFMLPEDWRDQSAIDLLRALNEDQVPLLLAWLSRQWWDGYNLGHLQGKGGEPHLQG